MEETIIYEKIEKITERKLIIIIFSLLSIVTMLIILLNNNLYFTLIAFINFILLFISIKKVNVFLDDLRNTSHKISIDSEISEIRIQMGNHNFNLLLSGIETLVLETSIYHISQNVNLYAKMNNRFILLFSGIETLYITDNLSRICNLKLKYLTKNYTLK